MHFDNWKRLLLVSGVSLLAVPSVGLRTAEARNVTSDEARVTVAVATVGGSTGFTTGHSGPGGNTTGKNNGPGGYNTGGHNNGPGGQSSTGKNNGPGGHNSGPGGGDTGKNNGPGGYNTGGHNNGPGGQNTTGKNNGPGGYNTGGHNNGPGGQNSTGKNNGPGGYSTGHNNNNNGPGGQNSTGKNNGPGGYSTGHNNNNGPGGHNSTGKNSGPGGPGYTTGHQSTGYTTGNYSTGYTTGYTTGNYSTGYTSTGYTTGPTTNTTGYTTGYTTGEYTTGYSTATVSTATVSTATNTTGYTTGTETTGYSTNVTSGTTGTSSTATSSSTTGEGSSSSSSSSSTSTSSSATGYKEEDKNELKAKLRPLFHLRFDYGRYIVNLTPQFRSVEPKSAALVKYDQQKANSESLVYGDYSEGFQKTVYGMIEVGLGAQVQFWFDNATGLRQYFWGYVGVLPIIGKTTESTRYVSTLDRAYQMGGRWSVPKDATDLDKWDAGDSITYLGHGGVIFSAGAGLGPVGVGVAKLATGTWETYVEKVGADRAYVKVTRGKLDSHSLFTHVAIVALSVNDFRYADDGFSYLFDLSTDTGRKAYEDFIRGNVLASEELSKQQPTNLVERAPVVKVETFRSVSSGKVVSKSMGLPIIWDRVYSKGRVNSFSTSDLHIQRNTAQVHYGIYSDSLDTRFWIRHTEKDFMFYGAKFSVENWDTKARMDSMFGTYSYSFKHEDSNGKRLRKGMHDLVKKTGIPGLMLQVPDRDLGYTGIEFNVNFNEENTMRLMAAAQRMSQDQFINLATNQLWPYFNQSSDPYDVCMFDGAAGLPGTCRNKVTRATAEGANTMYYALKAMYKTMNTDPKAFAAAYGRFGEGMSQNLFTFRTAMKIAGAGVGIDYLVEGTHISMYFKEWTTDASGNWLPATDQPMYKGLPFKPATRHTRVPGIVISNSPPSYLPKVNPVDF